MKVLERLGYEIVRQRGSHARLSKHTDAGEHKITIPLHATLAKGTLGGLLTEVSARNQISKDDLIEQLR